MRGRHNQRLPRRFDDEVQLEIEDGDDGRPTVRIQDRSVPEAWISAEIDTVVSLSECE